MIPPFAIKIPQGLFSGLAIPFHVDLKHLVRHGEEETDTPREHILKNGLRN
jgi:hypothetical protein